jgi:hypothetical protein
MAKIYAPPASIGEAPRWNGNYDDLLRREADWLDRLVNHLKATSSDPLVGEQIQFQVADNYARYVVASTKPLALIHLPFGDGYTFQYANRLTLKDIRDKVAHQKALDALFRKK